VESLPITFNNLPFSSFNVRRINYGGAVEEKTQIFIEGTTWSTIEIMNSNTAAIIEISP